MCIDGRNLTDAHLRASPLLNVVGAWSMRKCVQPMGCSDVCSTTSKRASAKLCVLYSQSPPLCMTEHDYDGERVIKSQHISACGLDAGDWNANQLFGIVNDHHFAHFAAVTAPRALLHLRYYSAGFRAFL